MRSYDFLLLVFKNYLIGVGYAKATISWHIHSVKRFIKYLKSINEQDIREVTDKEIKGFIKSFENKKGEKCLKKITIFRIVSSIRHFFRYLYRNDIILVNPIEEMPLKKEFESKKEMFSQKEINDFLECVCVKEECGQRDAAIFELMYSSGLRIGEIVNTNMEDIDLRERVLTVRQGKGGRDRYVPFSEVAEKFLELYIKGGRRSQVKKIKGGEVKSLFLTSYGGIKRTAIRSRFKKILLASGIRHSGLTVHSIRHSTATHLLENGADVRYVAELLGHESIESTVIYTHLLIDNLKREYKSAHPRENKYYEEVDEEYLENISSLKKEMLLREERNKKYPEWRYKNMRDKKLLT